MAKYALLVGINYRGTSSELRGCINDVKKMSDYLILCRGYSPNHITILTEDDSVLPTGRNIMHELAKLILKAPNASELWFHYSGHGSYLPDQDGDELDGRDETIVPLDYQSGMITDDQLHDYLEHLPDSCKMYCIFDCCHSGTILDLKYRYLGDCKNSVEHKESRLQGNVMMISGCRDNQTSADAWIKGDWAGAMTTSYLSVIEEDISCEKLLEKMRDYLIEHRYTQVPQLCSSRAIDESIKW